jgi:hypothetical protein
MCLIRLFPVAAATGVVSFRFDEAVYAGSSILLQANAWLRGVNLSDVTSVGLYGPAYMGQEAATPAVPLVNLSTTINGSYELTPAQFDLVNEGRMYLLLRTRTFPLGLLRGQVLLENSGVAVMTSWQVVPIHVTRAYAISQVVIEDNTVRIVYQRTFGTFNGTIVGATINNALPGVANGSVVCTAPIALRGNITGAGGFLCPTAFPEVATTNLRNGGWYAQIATSSFPNGDVRGQIIFPALVSTARLWNSFNSPANEVPPVVSPSRGWYVAAALGSRPRILVQQMGFGALIGPQTVAHIHSPAAPGANAPARIFFPALGPFAYHVTNFNLTATAPVLEDMNSGLAYTNVHSQLNPGGEIRGQIGVDVGPDAGVAADFSVFADSAHGLYAMSVAGTAMVAAAVVGLLA